MTMRAPPTSENEQAILLANRVLDRPSGDPDDNLAILARQFLRANERAQFVRPDPSLPYSITRTWDWSKLIPQRSVLVVMADDSNVDIYTHGPSVRWNNGAGLEKLRDRAWVRGALEKALRTFGESLSNSKEG